ncbi:hypothetical protein CDAR_566341 [Caerostris darwini]|uniref:Uncharacterized protein n=1 Tax=Caerostris darwini TaxID=1538125 RepID=A0AAV4UDE7_9ARAC|nr:hypothetical protein CDAR_566341 [Caerostris darwini]
MNLVSVFKESTPTQSARAAKDHLEASSDMQLHSFRKGRHLLSDINGRAVSCGREPGCLVKQHSEKMHVNWEVFNLDLNGRLTYTTRMNLVSVFNESTPTQSARAAKDRLEASSDMQLHSFRKGSHLLSDINGRAVSCGHESGCLVKQHSEKMHVNLADFNLDLNGC